MIHSSSLFIYKLITKEDHAKTKLYTVLMYYIYTVLLLTNLKRC